MTDPEFLDLEDVLLIHEEQLVRYGGSAGMRDQGLLESAIGMPRATFGGQFVHEDELNGYLVEEPPSRFYDIMIAIAERRMDKAGLAETLRQLSKPLGKGATST